MKSINIKVLGMNCGHCKKSVEEALKELEGVRNAVVSLEEKNVNVEYDENKVDTKAMIEAIKELEFEASI